MTPRRHRREVRTVYWLLGVLVLIGGSVAAWFLPGTRAARESVPVSFRAPLDRAQALRLLDAGRDVEGIVRQAAADTIVRRDIHALDLLAWGLYRAGRAGEAVPLARRAIATGSTEPLLRYHAGMIEFTAGDREAASRHLKVAMRERTALSELQVAEVEEVLSALNRGR
jgi:hypothetical protein